MLKFSQKAYLKRCDAQSRLGSPQYNTLSTMYCNERRPDVKAMVPDLIISLGKPPPPPPPLASCPLLAHHGRICPSYRFGPPLYSHDGTLASKNLPLSSFVAARTLLIRHAAASSGSRSACSEPISVRAH